MEGLFFEHKTAWFSRDYEARAYDQTTLVWGNEDIRFTRRTCLKQSWIEQETDDSMLILAMLYPAWGWLISIVSHETPYWQKTVITNITF